MHMRQPAELAAVDVWAVRMAHMHTVPSHPVHARQGQHGRSEREHELTKARPVLLPQLGAAEERQAATEAEVREEVSAEMGELLRDMEAGYRVRLSL